MSIDKTIYFDVSDVIVFARSNTRLSGIQRVSMEIIKHLSKNYRDHDIRLICYHPIVKRVVWFSSKPFSGNYAFNHSEFCKYFNIDHRSEGSVKIGEYLRKRYKSPLGRYYHNIRLRMRNMLDGGRTFAKRKIRAKRSRRFDAKNYSDVSFNKGDRVFISGEAWENLF